MSLALTLNNALSGLNVNQQALAVLSQNIANANTKGYSRQTISQKAVYLEGQGAGVSIDSISRKVDEFLLKSITRQSSVVGQTSVINDYQSRVQLLMGQPNANNSIDGYLNTFFNTLHALAQTPSDATAQRTAVDAGAALGVQMQTMSQGLRDLQFQADQDIADAITSINNDLSNLKQLNISIKTNLSLGKSVAELQDQRDQALNDLAQYMDVQTFNREDGEISISTAGGISILDDSLYQFSYTPAAGSISFANNSALSPIKVQRLNLDGSPIGNPITLVTGGSAADITSVISTGKIAGLLELRDHTLPNVVDQLDTLASSLRDQINAIHNMGSGFPGANSYTGTRQVTSADFSQWSGSVRIAVLQPTGEPVQSPYNDQPNGVPPLTLDLSTLDTGNGAGVLTVQDIINEINQYYGIPQNKAEVGNLNDIKLVSDSNTLPGSPPAFSFDFDLQNLSSTAANFYVTNVQVKDNNSVDITSLTSNVPNVALDPANTYVTNAGSTTVTINTTAAHNFTNGERIFLSTPGAAVDGIPAADLGGFFTISNVTSTSFEITVADPATAGGTFGVAGQTATPPYSQAASGSDVRTKSNGEITTSLAGNPASTFYTITVDVAVDDGNGNLTTSQLTYRVNNSNTNLLNDRYAVTNVTGGGTLVAPWSNQPLARALLVDANGNELPKTNGQYNPINTGYLKLQAGNSSNIIAIDSLDSKELGRTNLDPPVDGSGRGFSFYFDLNDFFHSNELTATGDTVAGSAANLAVEQRLRDNPGLVSTGSLTAVSPSADPNLPPPFTYERNASDGSIIQRISDLGLATLLFPASGGLSAIQQNYSGYAGQIVGSAASSAAAASANQTNAQTLLDGYNQRSATVSGVNLDTELANTVIYQNAYTASARVITVANDLFNILISVFQGG